MHCEVRVAANKGLGLFAKHPIPRGTRILAERPLVALRAGQRPSDILSQAQQLDEKNREQLLGLSWHPGNGIRRLGRWCEALGWVARDRAAARERIARGEACDGIEKTSAIVPGRMSEMVRSLNEAFRILSIFRSNSFNLASSATLSSEIRSSRPLPSTDSNTSSESSGLPKPPGSTDSRLHVATTSSSPAYELALFPAIARINHSCIPNAQANYHPLHQTFSVHATRDIPAGEEVSINYLPEHGQLRDQRVSKLEDGYGFTCNCPACNLDTEKGKQGEQSRKETQSSMKKTRALFTDSMNVAETIDAGYGADGMPETLRSTISDENQQQIDALRSLSEEERQLWLRKRELEVLNLMLGMYQQEGIAGREVASMYYHIARLQRSSGAYEDAMENAEAGLKLEENCLGADHPGYLEGLAFVDELKKDAIGAQTARM